MPLTTSRYRLLGAAALCVLVVVLLALLYKLDLHGLDAIDQDLESGPQGWTFRHAAAQHFFLFVQAAFTTLPMTIYTLVAAGLLAVSKHVRAAIWTIGVSLAATLTTDLLKVLLQRKRPVWRDPITTLSSFSFPSGHATGIAANFTALSPSRNDDIDQYGSLTGL